MDYLPNEVCLKILMFLSYFDLLNLSCVSKRMFLLCNSRHDFKKSVSSVWNVFEDRAIYHTSLETCRDNIFADIKRCFAKTLKSKSYLVKCLRIS